MRVPPSQPKRESMSADELKAHRKEMEKIGMRKRPKLQKPIEWTAEEILRNRSDDWKGGKA